MVWNYRFYQGVLLECSYDEQGQPDDYYSETSFEHLFSTEKYDEMVEEWTQKWECEKNGSIIEPREIGILYEDGTRSTEIYPPETIIIPPENVGTLEDYIKAKVTHDWQELKEAISEATWYDEQGFVLLAEEFEKPLEQRACILHLKTDEVEREKFYFVKWQNGQVNIIEGTPNESNQIEVIFDSEVNVWVAVGEDLPGLVTEADTLELLVEKLRVMMEELLLPQSSESSTLP